MSAYDELAPSDIFEDATERLGANVAAARDAVILDAIKRRIGEFGELENLRGRLFIVNFSATKCKQYILDGVPIFEDYPGTYERDGNVMRYTLHYRVLP